MKTLEEWRVGEGLTYDELAVLLGVTKSAARRYCLPRGHQDYRHPRGPELRKRIRSLTNGQVIFE